MLRIPLKAIGHSRGKPITVPEGNRSGVGAKRRWHSDVAKTDRNRQGKSVRSEAEAECWVEDGGVGQGAAVPCPASAISDPERRERSVETCNLQMRDFADPEI
jgi:hypothetical protein